MPPLTDNDKFTIAYFAAWMTALGIAMALTIGVILAATGTGHPWRMAVAAAALAIWNRAAASYLHRYGRTWLTRNPDGVRRHA